MKKVMAFELIITLMLLLMSNTAFAQINASNNIPDAYKPVLNGYSNYLKTNDTSGLEADAITYMIATATGGTVETIGYGLYDINDDGTPELFIGPTSNTNKEFYVMYALINNQPQIVFTKTSRTSEISFKILNDGTVFRRGLDIDDPISGYYSSYSTKYISFKNNQKSLIEAEYRAQKAQNSTDWEYLYDNGSGVLQPSTKIRFDGSYEPVASTVYTLNFTPFSKYDASTVGTPNNGSSSSANGTVNIYRLYNVKTGEHLYTSDANEANVLSKQSDWNNEGIGWTAPKSGTPVYRLYSPVTGVHLFTTDKNEVNVLSASGWSVDNKGNPLFYSGGSKPVYRLYSPALRMHLITTDANEYKVLGSQGWNQEGVKLNAK